MARERQVYYRANQNVGYTLIRNIGRYRNFTTFNVPFHDPENNNTPFYLSIQYEADGDCVFQFNCF